MRWFAPTAFAASFLWALVLHVLTFVPGVRVSQGLVATAFLPIPLGIGWMLLSSRRTASGVESDGPRIPRVSEWAPPLVLGLMAYLPINLVINSLLGDDGTLGCCNDRHVIIRRHEPPERISEERYWVLQRYQARMFSAGAMFFCSLPLLAFAERQSAIQLRKPRKH